MYDIPIISHLGGCLCVSVQSADPLGGNVTWDNRGVPTLVLDLLVVKPA